MKKRIGSLLGKPIIQGDTNLKTSNEVHISELNASSGGSSSGGDNTLNFRYYTNDDKLNLIEISPFALLKKCIINDNIIISAYDNGTSTAVAVDFNLKIFLLGGNLLSFSDYFALMGVEEDIDSYLSSMGFVEITKEEFYAV